MTITRANIAIALAMLAWLPLTVAAAQPDGTDATPPAHGEMDVMDDPVPADVPPTPPVIVTEPVPQDPPVPADDPAPEPTVDPTSHSPPPAAPEPESPEPADVPEPPADLVPEPTSEPTAIPTAEPTALPTAEPIAEPTQPPTPTPAPTPVPAIPFAPQLTCVHADGHGVAIAGDSAWSLLDCTLSWTTEDVSRVTATVDPAAGTGWDIVLIDPVDRDRPDLVTAHPQTLELPPVDSNARQFMQSRFFVGSRLACTAAASLDLPIQFTAVSGEDTVEEATARLTLAGQQPSAPVVQLRSATFASVDASADPAISTGTITLDYHDAPLACGWHITTVIDDFVSPSGMIPAADLTVVEVTGVPGATTTQDGGAITLHALPGAEHSASGTITLTVAVPMPEVIPEGDYTTTITSTSGLP